MKLVNKTGNDIVVPKGHTYQTVKNGEAFEVAEKDLDCLKFLFPKLEEEKIHVKVEPSAANDKKIKDVKI
jgi:hypothetical protein